MTSTHLALRQAAAKALDDWGGYGVSSGSAGGAVLPALIDLTTSASANRHDGAWMYSPTGGDARRIIAGSFVPTTGSISVELSWTAPSVATIIEMTHLFPAKEQVTPADTSYMTLIRRAHGVMVEQRRVSIAATTADTYTIGATFPWLDRDERIQRDEQGRMRIFETAQTASRHPVSAAWRGWKLIRNGASTALQVDVPYSAPTGTIYVDVLAPVFTLVNGAESTTGVVADADYVTPSVDDCLPFVLFEAYRALAAREPGQVYPETARMMKLYDAERRSSIWWDWTAEPRQQAAPAASGEEAA